MPRIFGYGFNPLSIYFCYRRDGALAALLYEVRNTFGERHSYLIPVEQAGGTVRQSCDKCFYVSPFMDMRMRYEFRVVPPQRNVSVVVSAGDMRRADDRRLSRRPARGADRRRAVAASAAHAVPDREGHGRDPLARAANVAEGIRAAAASAEAGAAGHHGPRQGTDAVSSPGTTLSGPAVGASPPRRARAAPRLLRRYFPRLLRRYLQNLEVGALRLTLPSGATIEHKGARPGPEAVLVLRRWRALWRIMIEGDLGLARAYMDDDCRSPDIKALARFRHAERDGAGEGDIRRASSRASSTGFGTRAAPIPGAAAAATSPRITISATTSMRCGSMPA